ncbi:hypothetical protein [Rubellimicrobium roseum]|uniref:Uncharacterized protein n=1 Tax=Rubellimicrobium roseum TaxID=687525 RepID=A0A5C4N742_9RHOB|nr:hypothetical protein [Rubellimicrobium roseum]TNC62079.1 hypothetical protein FHG71_20590 [Rubellimicrobium roseum]
MFHTIARRYGPWSLDLPTATHTLVCLARSLNGLWSVWVDGLQVLIVVVPEPPDLQSSHMSPFILPRRQVLCFLAWGTATACLPVCVPKARANDEDDRGSGQGRNRGRGRGGDDDNDRGREDSGRSRGESDRSNIDNRGGSEDRRNRNDNTEDRADDDRLRTSNEDASVLQDITVIYPDGWTERIADGSYELLDPLSRSVVRRSATSEDFNRMMSLR